jgi:hypothetical protein
LRDCIPKRNFPADPGFQCCNQIKYVGRNLASDNDVVGGRTLPRRLLHHLVNQHAAAVPYNRC